MANGWHRTNPNNPATQARRARYTSREHRQLRATIQTQIDHGVPTYCWRPTCRKQLTGRAWHLGHDDHDPTIYRGAECIPCNLRAAARKGNAVQRARRAAHVKRRRLL